jgi:RND family efflux transporter MFP subunit
MTTTTQPGSPSAGAGHVAKLLAVALGIGLFAFIGVRVRETLADRKTLAATLAESVKNGQKRADVAVVHATPKAWRPMIPVTGSLAAVQDADIGFKTGGRLVAVRAKVGDRVRAGQLLASLDVAEAQAQAAATAAAVRAAEVGYDMARDAEKRTQALFDTRSVSDAEALAAKNRSALALAQLEGARAQAQLAATGVANGTLTAPFAGLVTRAPSGVGKIVGPGEAMFHLEDTSVLKLSATLSEVDARLVEVGDEVHVEGEEGETDKGERAVVAVGKVTAVLGSLDAQTRRVPMLAEAPNAGPRPLLAGAFVRATVVSGRDAQVLVLPPGTLRPGSQDEVVVLTKAGTAHLARVVFTLGPDGSLLVKSGVTAADAVVASPSPEVRDGDPLGAAAP